MLGKVILTGDIGPLSAILYTHPDLANEPVVFGPNNEHRVHPLHFVCDCVFDGRMKEWLGLEMVELLMEYGANVDGSKDTTTQDSPLIAACSLYCESIALLFIDRGADTTIRGTHGGTALHWAAWTGSDKIVNRLIERGVPLNDQEDEFTSTPLLWAINGWLHPKARNHRNQPEVIRLLLEAGADPEATNAEGNRAIDLLSTDEHADLIRLFS